MNPSRAFSPEKCDDDAYALSLTDLTYQLYREGYQRSSEIHQTHHLLPGKQTDGLLIPEEQQAFLRLPPALLNSVPLQETFQARASERFYAPTSVPLSDLSTLLFYASEGDRQDWPREQPEANMDLQFCLVAWRVEGLAPAVYQYHAQEHALQRLHCAPDQPGEAEALVLQREFAYAPVMIVMLGNLATACAHYGARGHRQLLLRAGAAGQRLWFASLGLKLVGTVFAGFLAQAARSYLKTDGYTRLSLLAFACGYPFAREQT